MAGVQEQVGPGNRAVQAATEIIDQYGGFIRAVIRFQANGNLDEEDLFQEFFLALIRRPVPADLRDIKSYLYRAIVNHVIDTTRMHKSYQRFLAKYAREVRISIHNPDARSAFIEERKERTIAYCVRHLQERQAQAFVLRYRDNYSIPEIAARMRVGRRTVSRYLSQCLRNLPKVPAVE